LKLLRRNIRRSKKYKKLAMEYKNENEELTNKLTRLKNKNEKLMADNEKAVNYIHLRDEKINHLIRVNTTIRNDHNAIREEMKRLLKN
jgi:hypothetical protein